MFCPRRGLSKIGSATGISGVFGVFVDVGAGIFVGAGVVVVDVETIGPMSGLDVDAKLVADPMPGLFAGMGWLAIEEYT